MTKHWQHTFLILLTHGTEPSLSALNITGAELLESCKSKAGTSVELYWVPS